MARKTPLKNLLVEGVLRGQGGGLGLGEAVEDNREGALGDFARVEQFEGARGSIAWISKEGFPFFLSR